MRLRVLLAVTALGTAGAGGCAAVTGLDGYSKGDCSGGLDCDGGGPADSSVDARVRVDATSGDDSASGDDSTSPDGAGEAAAEATAPDGPTSDGAASDGPRGDGEAGTVSDGGGDGAADASDGGKDSGSDAGADSGADAGNDSGVEAGCGPTNTTSNCGACGVACTPTFASADSCNGISCSYTCLANHSDCNLGVGANTDGCECATPGCCGTGCQTTHSDGTGQSFYDCNPVGTYNVVQATAACTAYALSVGGSAANCSDGWSCNNKAPYTVCYGNTQGTTCSTFCWGYNGTQGGELITCACPDVDAGSWK